ncbi:MAG: hypothetical protein BAJATHORv1_30338 [Candidatus Thorarchaeota archaeon]|nr:MAG: hypothetical protein BAJATHORv1_30338 [Candidatus Thorarchaeota archaeon]
MTPERERIVEGTKRPVAAVFWDAENVTFKDEPRLSEEFRKWLKDNFTVGAMLAFADWNGPYRPLGRLLYKIGFDLIHVPDELKDSADCQMAAYMIDWLIHSPETQYYIIVSGDAVFEPFVRGIQKQNKLAVIISNPMITRPETVLRSDIYLDIDSFRPPPTDTEGWKIDRATKTSPEVVRNTAFRRLQESISKLNKLGRSTPIRYVRAVVEHLNPEFRVGIEHFDGWDQIIQQAIAEDLVRVEGGEPFAELVLTDKVAKITKAQTDSLDAALERFAQIVRDMHAEGEHTGMESVVQRVRKEKINYNALGYSKFGDFARAAESRDLVRIVDQGKRPPVVKPVYAFDEMLEWYKQNTREFFGPGAKVPQDPFIKRTIQFLNKYDVSIKQMEKYLKDEQIRYMYERILETSGLSFIPPYEQILISILFGKGWTCKDAIEVINRELAPLGYAVECPK